MKGDEKKRLLTRREFLRRGVTLAAASVTVPTFLSRTAWAMQNPYDAPLVSSKPGIPDDHVLLVVQLSGGNDGVNTVIPYRHDRYYQLRPTLSIAKDSIIRLSYEIGLHPGLVAFKNLIDQGVLSIVQGVGYPNPNRSHFRSMEIWQTGVSDGYETTGWIGRVFDHVCNNAHLEHCSPTLGISVGNTLNPSLRGENGIGVAVQDPERLFRMTQLYAHTHRQENAALTSGNTRANAQLEFLRRTALNAELSADKIRRSVRQVQNHTDYPKTPFARGLKLIAGMIAGGLDTRVYYISMTGFDTHANQHGQHERLLKMLAEGIAAFQNDLDKLGQAERVVGMTFSEFGRRVAENGSRGTDHGKAAPMFIFGKPVKAGLIGEHPSLDNLANGDLQFHTDFRSVYATLLQDWLGVEAEEILGQRFDKLDLV
ncbi:MAG: DUF1501 domain-containing protein [bacterium]